MNWYRRIFSQVAAEPRSRWRTDVPDKMDPAYQEYQEPTQEPTQEPKKFEPWIPANPKDVQYSEMVGMPGSSSPQQWFDPPSSYPSSRVPFETKLEENFSAAYSSSMNSTVRSDYEDNVHDEFSFEMREWSEGVSITEKGSFYDYFSDDHTEINSLMRGKLDRDYYDDGDVDEHWIELKMEELDTKADDMYSSLNKARFPFSMKLWRGTSSSSITEQWDQLEIGGTFQDKGFLSCSISEQEALDFTSSIKQRYLLEMVIPAGARAAYVGRSVFDDRPNEDEKEALVQAGSKFIIRNKFVRRYNRNLYSDQDRIMDVRVLQLEYVMPDDSYR